MRSITTNCALTASATSVILGCFLSATLSAGAAVAPRQRPAFPQAHRSEARLYAAVQPLNEVLIYDPTSGTVVGTISSGVNTPYGLFLDRSGHLYVANNGSSSGPSSVTVYARSASNPVATYPIPMNELARGEVVRHGRIFVLVQDRSTSMCHLAIEAYTQGSATPYRKIELPQTANCFTPAITLDSHHDIYVSYDIGSASGTMAGVTWYAPGSWKPNSLTFNNFNYGNDGLLVDAAGNVLINGCVTGSTCDGINVWLFPAGQTAPSEQLTPNSFGNASGVAFGPGETSFYVGDIFGGAIYEYSYPQDVLVNTITGPSYVIRGLAVGKGP